MRLEADVYGSTVNMLNLNANNAPSLNPDTNNPLSTCVRAVGAGAGR